MYRDHILASRKHFVNDVSEGGPSFTLDIQSPTKKEARHSEGRQEKVYRRLDMRLSSDFKT